MVGYAIGHSLFGKIFDMIGTRLGFVLAIVVWSISIMLHAAARGVLSLGLVRAMLGVSEAGNWPGATKSNAEWFPIKERGACTGNIQFGRFGEGAIVSAPVIALLYLQFGWQGTFYRRWDCWDSCGSFPGCFVYKAPPERHPWLTDEERGLHSLRTESGKNCPRKTVNRQRRAGARCSNTGKVGP